MPQADQLEALMRDLSVPHTEVAKQAGMSESSVRRRRKALAAGETVAAPSTGTLASGDYDTELELLRQENRELRKRGRDNSKSDLNDERALRAIETAAEACSFSPPTATSPRRTNKSGADVHHRQAAIWSDWHAGETVDSEAMGGLNEFSWPILESRVEQLVASMLSFARVRPPLTGLDLWVLGDMASGAIHGLEETNEVPAAEQYVRVGQLIGWAVSELAPHYPDVHASCTFGNHPRSKDAPVSKRGHDSGDWIAYQMAAACTRHLENVTWDIPKAGMIVRQIAGLNYLLWHGDGVRSSMPGVPWGGVMRRWNVLRATYGASGVRLDAVALGHFHQACVVPSVFMNGSLIGQNEYSLKNFGGGEAPCQMLLTFDEKRSRLTDVGYVTID